MVYMNEGQISQNIIINIKIQFILNPNLIYYANALIDL